MTRNRNFLALVIVILVVSLGALSMRERPPTAERPLVFTASGPNGVQQLHLQALTGQALSFTAETDGSRWPMLSPDGKLVGFVGKKNDYCVIGADGNGFRKLVDGGRRASWAPDSRRLAIEVEVKEIHSVLIADVAGGAVTNLTNPRTESNEGSPMWSPDGRSIAIVRGDKILVIDPQTTEPKFELNTPDGVKCTFPRWSSDGQWLLFLSSDVHEKYSLQKVRPADGKKVVIYGGALANEIQDPPSWSPDGKRILFWSRAGSGSAIYVVDAEGGPPSKLRGDEVCWNPRWSGDGKRIAFVGQAESLYVMNADGSETRLIYPGATEDVSW